MTRLLKTHLDWVLVAAAILMLLFLTGVFSWSVSKLTTAVNSSFVEGGTAVGESVDLEAARKILRDRGLLQ